MSCSSCWLVASALSAAAAAQNDFDLDKTAAGTLGSALQLGVRNAPANMLLIAMPSFTAGPTPIFQFDPRDPRSLQVGAELFANWFTLFTSATGSASFGIALPNVPAYHGTVMHWQTLTLPGTTLLVDRISNDVVTVLGSAGLGQALAGVLGMARGYAATFVNPLFDNGAGDVVIAGGGVGILTAVAGSASTEIWGFRRLDVRPGPPMTSARALHLAVPLQSGRVLLIGGASAVSVPLAGCEVYDPATNSFAPTGSMATPRILHAAARLADGRVMVAGGTSRLVDIPTAIGGALNSVEIYDPATGLWSTGPALGGNRLSPALTLLPNGRMMASGGVQIAFQLGVPISAASTTAVQIYDPATNSWANGAPMAAARAGNHGNQVMLANGRVLMTGGIDVPNLLGVANALPIAGAEYYDQPSNSWTTVSMHAARSMHSATRLPDGRVAVCGGAQGTLALPIAIADVEVFDPGTNAWTVQQPLTTPRSGHAARLQPDGLLVLFGGQGLLGTMASIEGVHFQ